jgi:hypothetical protein
VASVLSGAWRAVPPRLEVHAGTVAELAPLLQEVGAAGLAWWKVLHSGLGEAPEAEEIRQAYQVDALRAALHLQSIRVVVPRLRAAGIEPVLIKGWGTARLYPKPGLRPYVDLDLVVPPGMGLRAEATLQADPRLSSPDHPDVLDAATWAASGPHGPQGDLVDHPWEAVLERSRLVPLGDLPVRVLGPEDHLRLSAVHAVRHRFSRPAWLCDIGLLMETLPERFDWAYCLAGRGPHTERVVRSLGLAHHLLGADLHDCLPTAIDVPSWLIESVLRRWGTPPHEGPGPSILLALRHPRALPGELFRRWPDPLETTLRHHLPLTGKSRFARQACDFTWRFGVLSTLRRLRP